MTNESTPGNMLIAVCQARREQPTRDRITAADVAAAVARNPEEESVLRGAFERVLRDDRTYDSSEAMAEEWLQIVPRENLETLLDGLEGIRQLDPGQSVDLDVVLEKADLTIEKALAILDRVPDVPPEPGDEMPESEAKKPQ